MRGTLAVIGQSCGRCMVKLVGSGLTTLNVNKVLGTLPDMTSWALNVLVEHKSAKVVSQQLSKVEDS